ncbi:MAG TPA: glucoamylase family protein [Bacteroidales bacterium]|nr:glucoamylase family protein [Bacteroidales bacterium]
MKNIMIYIFFLTILLSASCGGGNRHGKADDEKTLLTDDSLLTLVEYRTFQYFWDGAEPNSGMARERINVDGVYPENDENIVTTGGSGFGIMALLVGMERGFITREEGYERFVRIVNFLGKADRFHGAWPHWIDGETGHVKPFGQKDDGADIVETAYLMQGMLAARQYFINGSEKEKALANNIDSLWKGVEWTWFTRGGQHVLYWHWSPDYGWQMNFPVRGYNECLILYIMAASSPTYPINPAVYHDGWARGGEIDTTSGAYGYVLSLKHNGALKYGGPLFWAHYSYLGLDPHNLKDMYADYWQENTDQTLINWKWCSLNPKHYKGYSSRCWGLTASYSINFYAAHSPGEKTDLGVISPTAALSSFPYTPDHSMDALKYFYYTLGDKIWGKFGFYDAFSEQNNWYPQKYLAIDQGPEVVMIENYRTGLLWNLFMSGSEVQEGLKRLGFTYSEK